MNLTRKCIPLDPDATPGQNFIDFKQLEICVI